MLKYILIFLLILYSCSSNKKSTIAPSKNKKNFSKILRSPDEADKKIKMLFEKDIVYRFGEVNPKPVITKRKNPYYPDIARKKQIEGTVVITIIIDENGDVIYTDVYKSIPLLNEPTIEAAKQCKFKPAEYNGKKVKVWMNIPFKFSLR